MQEVKIKATKNILCEEADEEHTEETADVCETSTKPAELHQQQQQLPLNDASGISSIIDGCQCDDFVLDDVTEQNHKCMTKSMEDQQSPVELRFLTISSKSNHFDPSNFRPFQRVI